MSNSDSIEKKLDEIIKELKAQNQILSTPKETIVYRDRYREPYQYYEQKIPENVSLKLTVTAIICGLGFAGLVYYAATHPANARLKMPQRIKPDSSKQLIVHDSTQTSYLSAPQPELRSSPNNNYQIVIRVPNNTLGDRRVA